VLPRLRKLESTSQTLVSPSSSGNRLLDSLPKFEFDQVNLLLEAYPMRMRETLQEAGEPVDFVYFPTSGIASLLTILDDGAMIEFATVGREGTTGVPLLLGIPQGSTMVISQLDGESLRMTAADFTSEIADNPAFSAIVLRYAGVLLALAAQSAACNRAHDVASRCARWLLMTHDQARNDEFKITQEFLAQMLGVGRSSVSEVAGSLQTSGIVSYHRGVLIVLDRTRLEAAACECYVVVSNHLASLPGPHADRFAPLDGALGGEVELLDVSQHRHHTDGHGDGTNDPARRSH